METPDFPLTTREAARLIGVPAYRLDALLRRDRVPVPPRVGRELRWGVREILAAVDCLERAWIPGRIRFRLDETTRAMLLRSCAGGAA